MLPNIDLPPALNGAVGIYGTPFTGGLGDGGIGLDAEIGAAGLPITIGAMGMVNVPGFAPQGLLYLRTMPFEDSRSANWGFLLGGGWTWTNVGCAGVGECFRGAVVGPPGLMAGFTYQWRWANQWLRLQPNVMVIPGGWSYTLAPITTLVMGPAWLEYGYRIGDHFELSLRSTLAPVRVAWRF